MGVLKLKRGVIDDPAGNLGKIKGILLMEAYRRKDMSMIRALVMVGLDVSRLVTDCIERVYDEGNHFITLKDLKGGD